MDLYACFVDLGQERNERGKAGAIPQVPSRYGGAKSVRGAPNRQKVPTMSQVLPSIHYICFQKTSHSNMGAPNLLLAPGAMCREWK